MSQANVDLIREGFARWRAGDWDFLLANAAPDVELFTRASVL
jgi:ketosteroid isomerase-like protein